MAVAGKIALRRIVDDVMIDRGEDEAAIVLGRDRQADMEEIEVEEIEFAGADLDRRAARYARIVEQPDEELVRPAPFLEPGGRIAAARQRGDDGDILIGDAMLCDRNIAAQRTARNLVAGEDPHESVIRVVGGAAVDADRHPG